MLPQSSVTAQLLFMRSGWKTQCVDAAVDWLVIRSFQSLSWGWIWMGLWIVMLFSIFFCTVGKLRWCRNLRGPFTLCLDRDGSEVVDCISVAIDRYIVSFDLIDCCCVWKMVLSWFGSLGRFAWSWLICCFNAEYRWAFLRLRFLARHASWQDSGCSVESIRVVWSVSPAWEAVELTLGDRLHLPVRGPRPYRFRSDNRGCSRTNAWRFSTFPRRRLPAFLVKLVPCDSGPFAASVSFADSSSLRMTGHSPFRVLVKLMLIARAE